MFVVTVTFILKPGARNEFLPLMMENARLSVSLELGCRQFDVCARQDVDEEIFLYEVYDSEDAFSAHLAMRHYLEFTEKVGRLISEKTVRTYSMVG